MPTLSNIGVDEPGTIDLRVETVTIDEGGTLVRREIVCLGDPDTSNAMVASTNAQPASTSWGLVIRQVGDSTVTPLAGSTWAVRPLQSSAADLQMTATPVAGSTWNTRPLQSTAADLRSIVHPVLGPPYDSSGTARNFGFVAITGSSVQSTVVSSVARQIRVLSYMVVSGSTNRFQFASGSTASTSLLTGGMIELSSFSGVSFAGSLWGPAFQTVAGQALVIDAASTGVRGHLSYVEA